MTFEVRHPEVEETLKELGKTIGEGLPKGFGFSLLLFSIGENGSTFYISNCNREDVIKGMQEFIEKQEKPL